MSVVLTVRLNDAETAVLGGLVQASGKSRSDLVREALRQKVLLETLRLSHEELAPQARATGWLTEDDILRDVS
jgi:predicted transcriptional regulator